MLVTNYIVCTLVPMEVDMQIIKVGKDAKKMYLEGHEVYKHRYGNNFVFEMIVQCEGYVDRSLRNTNLHWWNSLVKPFMKLLSCCCCSFGINIMRVISVTVWRLLQFNWCMISPLSSIFAVDALDEDYPDFSVILHVGFVVSRVLLAQVVILAFWLPSVKLFTVFHIHSFFHSI